MALTFDIIGDSHLARIQRAHFVYPLMGTVQQFVRGGSGIRYLETVVDDIESSRINRPYKAADVTIIFIGGNDLDRKQFVGVTLAKRYAAVLGRLVNMGSMVMFMGQWRRPSAYVGEINFNTNMLYFEHLLECYIPKGCWLWEWDRQLRVNEYFYVDGCHCEKSRYKKVVRYLAAAGVAAARYLRMVHCM